MKIDDYEDIQNQLIDLIWPMLDDGATKAEIAAMFSNVLESWEPDEEEEKRGGTAWEVYQDYKSFGDPGWRRFSTKQEAEAYAWQLAETIATKRWGKWSNGDAKIDLWALEAGSPEMDFYKKLDDWARRTDRIPGRLPWKELVRAIYTDAVVVVQQKEGETQERYEHPKAFGD